MHIATSQAWPTILLACSTAAGWCFSLLPAFPPVLLFICFYAEAKGFVVRHKTVLYITSGFPLEFLSWFPSSCLSSSCFIIHSPLVRHVLVTFFSEQSKFFIFEPLHLFPSPPTSSSGWLLS